jgi:multidrug efflux system membrane fusion protein
MDIKTTIICAAALLVAACGGKDAGPAGKAAGGGAPVPVVTAVATQQSVALTLEAIGNVEALASVAIKSLVDGQITEVRVKDGQDVSRGQALLQIDPRPYQVKLAEAQANLARDQSLLATAQAQEQRYQELAAGGFVSKNDFAQVRNNVATARAAIAADDSAIATAKLQLDYANIRAPIAGRLGKIALQAGNLVKANDANPLVTLNQIDPIYVSFTVPEAQFGPVRAAMDQHTLAVTARDQQSLVQFEGQLSFVDNAVDAGTGTVRLRATFANPKGQLLPGQFVSVALTLGNEDALTVPPDALQTGPKGQYVFVVEGENKAQMHAVTVARSTAHAAVIASGLKPGDKVVIDGQSRLTPGAPVSEHAAGEAAKPAALQ